MINYSCSFEGNRNPCSLLSKIAKQSNTVCSGQISKEIEFIDEEATLHEAIVDLENGKRSSYCCHNTSHSILFFGDQCSGMSNTVNDICNFSNHFSEGICDFRGIQTVIQVCRVPEKRCALKRSFSTFCGQSDGLLKGCLYDSYPCD